MPELKEIFNFLGRGLAAVTEPCRIPNCNAHSLGFICKQCSRYVCNYHAYATMPGLKKPEVICASCVIDRHEELLDVHPPPRTSDDGNGASRVDDPNVVDAEWERVG